MDNIQGLGAKPALDLRVHTLSCFVQVAVFNWEVSMETAIADSQEVKVGGSIRMFVLDFFSKWIPRATTAGWLFQVYSASAFVFSVASGESGVDVEWQGKRGNLGWKVRIADQCYRTIPI